jgi:hypothetical protein
MKVVESQAGMLPEIIARDQALEIILIENS